MPNQRAVMDNKRLLRVNAKKWEVCISNGKVNQLTMENGDETIMMIANQEPIPRVLTVERGRSK
jgi:hypothetical protein